MFNLELIKEVFNPSLIALEYLQCQLNFEIFSYKLQWCNKPIYKTKIILLIYNSKFN